MIQFNLLFPYHVNDSYYDGEVSIQNGQERCILASQEEIYSSCRIFVRGQNYHILFYDTKI